MNKSKKLEAWNKNPEHPLLSSSNEILVALMLATWVADVDYQIAELDYIAHGLGDNIDAEFIRLSNEQSRAKQACNLWDADHKSKTRYFQSQLSDYDDVLHQLYKVIEAHNRTYWESYTGDGETDPEVKS